MRLQPHLLLRTKQSFQIRDKIFQTFAAIHLLTRLSTRIIKAESAAHLLVRLRAEFATKKMS